MVGCLVVVLEGGWVSEEVLEFSSSEDAEEEALEYDLIFSTSLMALLLFLFRVILVLCGVDILRGLDSFEVLPELL